MPTDERVVVSLGAVTIAFQGPPRPSQRQHCVPIINGNIGPPRTPKCDSWRSWARESANSNPGARARVPPQEGVQSGRWLWTVIIQLALTAQRQLTKNRVPDSTCHKLTTCCPLGAETYVFWDLLRRFLEFLRETGCEKELTKIKFVVLASMYAVGNVSCQDRSEKRV